MGKAKAGTDASKTWDTSTQSGSTGIDPATQAYIDQMRQTAQGASMPTGVSTGMAALGGDPNAVKTLMNPYQQNVIDGIMGQWKNANAMGMNQVNDAATRAGAFGGSRQGVATGVMMGENARNATSQIGDLLNSGYNNAMGQAGALVNLGMGGAGDPNAYRLGQLQRGFAGTPYGQTYSGTSGRTSTGVRGYTEGKIGLFS